MLKENNELHMLNILVTGGAGFIGIHTCLALLEKGYKIFIVDSFINSTPKSIERLFEINNSFKNKIHLYRGNLEDKEFLNWVFSDISIKKLKVDGVIHFAGLKAVEESVLKPLSYWHSNVVGTLNLIEVMRENNCKNLVFSSTAAIYESKDNSLLTEKSVTKPINPYGNTKLTIEKILKDVFQGSSKDWKFASLRYFNPIGAHSSGLIGEDPKGLPNNIFPNICNTALGFQKVLKIFGKDWPTKDGTTVRDYIHVMDLAEAHLKVLDYLLNNDSIYFHLNLGTGKGISIMDLINTFEDANGIKVPYVFAARRRGDNCFVVADNSLAIKKYKIITKRNLEDMCRDGWKWKKLNPKGY